MKQVFNLKKTFDQIRLAMAGEWLAYGKQMQWWRIDEIESGDPSWKEWVHGNPEKGLKPNTSLINALADARNEYYKKKLLFRARYGVTDDEVDAFYRMYIGYSPMKGMYAMHIGPYTAMPGAWSRTLKLLKDYNKPLNPQSLLELSNSIPLPTFPEGFDPEAKENKKDQLVKQYKSLLRDKRGILEVRADLMNKFSYFLKTYNQIDRANMNRGVNIYLQQLLKSVGAMFTEDDIGVIVKAFPPDRVGQLDGKVPKINSEFQSIDPNTPEGSKLMTSGTLLGNGSILTLNSKGIQKLLAKTAQDGNWQDLYEQAIQVIAQANGKTVDETRFLVAEDDNFSKLFLEQLQNIQAELKNAGDFRADFLTIALNKKPKNPPRVGAQRPQVHRISKTQKSIINLKMDILKTILDIGTDDPAKVAQTMNAERKIHKTKAKGKYDAETVQMWINAIKSEDQEIQKMKKKKQIRTYQEIYDTTVKDFNLMNENEELRDAGQEDLDTAYRFASTTFMESPVEFIDPRFRTKIQLPNAPNMFAREGEEDAPVTAKKMTELRMEARKMGTEEEMKKALKEEILKEIGNADVETSGGLQGGESIDPGDVEEEDTTVGTPSEPAPTAPDQTEMDFPVTTMPQEKEPVPQLSPVEEEVSEEEEVSKKLDLKNLFGHTLQSLIIMARDLDSQGKEEAVEEIHQVIRKYQGRI